MRILLKGYFYKNLGDDLMAKVICERYPQVDFEIVKGKGTDFKAFKSIKNLKIINMNYPRKIYNKIIELISMKTNKASDFSFNPTVGELNYKKYDAIVEIGGSIFIETPAFAKYPYIGAKRRMKELEKVENIFFIGQNFGPFFSNIYYDVHRKIFKRVKDICFRDSYSYNLFKNLDSVRFAFDSVLNLKYKPKILKENGYVLISVIDLKSKDGKELSKYYENYEKMLTNLTKALIANNEKIKFMSFCENQSDSKAIERIKEKLSEKEKKSVSEYIYDANMEESLDVFFNAKSVIASRYHSLILSLLYKKPVFPISYDIKTTHTLEDLKITDYVDIKKCADFDSSYIIENIKLYENSEKIIENANLAYRALDEFVRDYE